MTITIVTAGTMVISNMVTMTTTVSHAAVTVLREVTRVAAPLYPVPATSPVYPVSATAPVYPVPASKITADTVYPVPASTATADTIAAVGIITVTITYAVASVAMVTATTAFLLVTVVLVIMPHLTSTHVQIGRKLDIIISHNM